MKTTNIVILMDGQGSRFAAAGFPQPKPLIPVFGKPMIEVVVKNLRPSVPHRFIFICSREHAAAPEILATLKAVTNDNFRVVPIEAAAEGTARTVLMAKALIDNDDALVVANGDQFVHTSIDQFLDSQGSLDGVIMTMSANDSKWPYVRTSAQKQAIEVREKGVISSEAAVGVYSFSTGRAFCRGAEAMITAGETANGATGVASVYNHLVRDGARVGTYNIGSPGNGMYELGAPDDLARFVDAVSKTATKKTPGG